MFSNSGYALPVSASIIINSSSGSKIILREYAGGKWFRPRRAAPRRRPRPPSAAVAGCMAPCRDAIDCVR